MRLMAKRLVKIPCLCGGKFEYDFGLSMPGQSGRCTDPISGWYNDIDANPVYIRDRHHLKEECDKRGLVAEVLKRDVGRSGKKDFQNVISRVNHRARRDPHRTREVSVREANCDARTLVY